MRLLAGAWLLLYAVAAAPLNDFFSPSDADSYVEAALRTLGESDSSLSDRDHAAHLLSAFGKGSAAAGYKASACHSSAAGLQNKDLEAIHHGASLRTGVGCTSSIPPEAGDIVATALQEDDLQSLYHGALSAPHLGVELDVDGVLEKLLDLLQPDGSVRSAPRGPPADANVSLAAELLAELAPKAGEQMKKRVRTAAENMRDNNLGAEPALLSYLNVASGTSLAIKPSKLKSMASILLESSRTTRPKSRLAIYKSLTAIAGYPKAPLPMKLEPVSPSTEDMSSGHVRVKITSLLGSSKAVRAITLLKLTNADGSDMLSDESRIPLGKPNVEGYSNMPKIQVSAGLYTAEFAIEVGDGDDGKALTAKLPVAVSSTVSLGEIRLTVSDARSTSDPSMASHTLQPGDVLPQDAYASVLEGHRLDVDFSLNGDAADEPHQAFVRFTHAVTGLTTFFVASPLRKSRTGASATGGDYAVSVLLAEETSTFLQRSGTYEMAIVVGGPIVQKPLLGQIGLIDLDFPVAKSKDWPIYSRALLHETDVSLGPLPEKHHTFREPAARPPTAVSLLFTVLVLVPLVGLVYGLKVGGANFRRVPRSKFGMAWCVAYQACMVGIVGLFVTYWATLTMAYTLQVLAVMSVMTTFIGRKALQAVAMDSGEKRQGRQSTHVKSD